MEHRALGKGLSALIPEKVDLLTEKGGAASVSFAKTSLIRDNALQPRTNYDEAKMEELRNSIKEKGVLQPILVRPVESGYEVIAGERRLKAARDLKLDEIPVIIKDVSPQEALVLALVENIQREELNPIEEAQAFTRLIEGFSLTQDEVAQSVGKDRSTISNTMRLLKLPDSLQKAVSSGSLSMGHARALLALEEEPLEQKRLFDLVMKKGLSVREIESLIRAREEGASRRKKIKTSQQNHEIVLLEEELQHVLGTKVRIQSQKKRGKIIIEYYSLDDLERILQVFKKSK